MNWMVLRLIGCFLLAATTPAWADDIVVFSDDFEDGYGQWTPRVFPTLNNDLPALFEPVPEGIHGPNTGYPNSHAAGFTSNIQKDNTMGNWIQRQFPGAVPPGVYNVTLELDLYVWRQKTSDRHSVGNRLYVLTNNLYDNPLFRFDGGVTPGYGINGNFWPGHVDGINDWNYNGVWQHRTISGTINTTTGDIELRLLMHDKNSGAQTVAWDNVQLRVGTTENPNLFEFTEDFEQEGAMDNWTVQWYLPYFDTPQLFPANDPLLYTNTWAYPATMPMPQSQSVGYSSDLQDGKTEAAWLEKQFLGLVQPGTYLMRLEFDWYVYKNKSQVNDPWAVGNRVFLLTDQQVGNPTLNFDVETNPSPGFVWVRWPGRIGSSTNWGNNGVWLHQRSDVEITTTTGNFELRLLLHNKSPRQQAVAWDNVRLSIINPCNPVRYDADGDLDVDQEDFGILQACLTGPDRGPLDLEKCRCVIADTDNDVDGVELTAFKACALTSGPDIPADPACDDALPNP